MSGIDDLEFGDGDDEEPGIPPEALDELLAALEERGFDTSDFQYLGVNIIPQGEGLRGVTFNDPGSAFDHYRNSGVPASMIHLVFIDDDTWQVYISGSP